MNRSTTTTDIILGAGFLVAALSVAGCDSSSGDLADARRFDDAAHVIDAQLVADAVPVLIDARSVDASRADASLPDASSPDASRADASRADASRADASRADASPPDASRVDASPPDASPPDATIVAAVCGNGVVESGEQCDDGNGNGNALCPTTNCIVDTCLFGPKQTGTGLHFAAPVGYSSGGNIDIVEVGNFDRSNSALDIEVAEGGSDTITALINGGDGTFTAIDAHASGFAPFPGVASTAVGDFDRDGNLDLAVPAEFDSAVHIFFGAGDGTFSAVPTELTVGGGAVSCNRRFRR